MDLKIVKEEKSALPRKEIKCELVYEQVTPSRSQIVQSIASKTKAKDTLIIVKNIYTTYGDKKAKINAYIYDNEDAMNAIEYKKMVEKNKPKAPEPKVEEAKAEKTDADKPAEEVATEKTDTAPAEEKKAEKKPTPAENTEEQSPSEVPKEALEQKKEEENSEKKEGD